MKNTKLYYFLQIGIVAISLVTFMKFTYPYLNREEVKPSNELSEFLQQRSSEDSNIEEAKPETSPIKRYPRAKPPSYRVSTPTRQYASTKPQFSPPKKYATSETFKKDLKVEPEDDSDISKKIESSSTKPETFRQQIHVEGSGPVSINKHIVVDKKESESIKSEGLTLDKVERFFKFTSSIVGTVFPLVGFSMTVLLWRNQRKEKKLQST